jgi:Siphovirus Gp157
MSKPHPSPPPAAPSAWQLERSISLWQQLQQAVVTDNGAFVADEDVIEKLIDNASPSLHPPAKLLGMLIDAAVWAERREDEAEALRKRYAARRDRYAARATKLRATINDLMDILGSSAAEGDLGSASYVKPPRRVVITDMNLLPEEYIRRTDPEAKKTEIASALRGGKAVPGAEWSDTNAAPVLRITAY